MASQVTTTISPESQDWVFVPTEDLPIGIPVRLPVRDDQCRLLLAEGSVVSSDLKQLLIKRQIFEVAVDQDDLWKFIEERSTSDEDPLFLEMDEYVSQKLAELLNSGSLFGAGADFLSNNNVVHGYEGHGVKRHEQLVERHRATGKNLDALMSQALCEGRCDVKRVISLAADLFPEVVSDQGQIRSLANQVAREPDLARHCVCMSLLGMAIGLQMKLGIDDLRMIGMAGLIHDWGMIQVPESIRNASRPLTANELMEVRKHPAYIFEILEKLTGVPGIVSLVCYQIHERPNGSGYPKGRQGKSIHQFARILHVADAYLALTSPRPFRPPLMKPAAIECLIRQAHRGDVDPVVVRALLHTVSLFPVGSYVLLSDGSLACVVKCNGSDYASPTVRLLRDSQGREVATDAPGAFVDLARSPLGIESSVPTPGRHEIELSSGVLGHSTHPIVSRSQKTANQLPEISASPDQSNIEALLESLDRRSRESECRESSNRKYERKPFRSPVTLLVPDETSVNEESSSLIRIEAWSRNISQEGLCVIYPGEISSREIVVCLGESYFRAEIVRSRAIQDGFWEYGIALKKRLREAPSSVAASTRI